jgi:hypothetical protein
MAGGIWLIVRRSKIIEALGVSVDMGNNGGEGINKNICSLGHERCLFLTLYHC